MSDNLFTVTEAAKILGVSADTLRRAEKRGKISPQRDSGNQRLYTRKDVSFLREILGKKPAQRTFSIEEAAKIAGVTPHTLRRWEKEGKIDPDRTPGGHRRFTKQDITNLKERSFKKESPVESKEPVKPKEPNVYIETLNKYVEETPELYKTLHIDQKRILKYSLLAFALALLIVGSTKIGLSFSITKPYAQKISSIIFPNISNNNKTSFNTSSMDPGPSVLQASTSLGTITFNVGVASNFKEDATFEKNVDILGNLTVQGTVTFPSSIDLGGNLTVTGDETLTGNLTGSSDSLILIGGISGVSYNAFASSSDAADESAISSSNDLYVGGDLEVDGTIYGTLATAPDATTLDSIDSTSFLRSDESDSFTSGTLTFSDGTLLDLSSISQGSTTPQGLKLPQASSFSNPSSGEGYIAWDTTNSLLKVYDGSSWSSISGGGPSGSGTAGYVTYWTGTGTISGNSSFYWDSTAEKLGIGGTPVGKLDVSGAVTGKALAIFNETGDQDIFTASASGSTKFVIDHSGQIGVGVTSPSSALDVAGKISISGTQTIYNPSGTFTGTLYIGNGGSSLSHTTGNTSYYNTALGIGSLFKNTTGFRNTALGHEALYNNTGGYYNNAVGETALFYNLTGNYNTANGAYALLYSKNSNNSAVGAYALYNLTTGSENSAVGVYAGAYITGGSTANQTSTTSLYLGNNTKALADGDTNEIVIGYDATGIGSNSVVLGNDSITTTSLKGKVGIGTNSPDAKLQLDGAVTGKALAIFNETGDQDILTASASGSTVFNLTRTGIGEFDGGITVGSGGSANPTINLGADLGTSSLRWNNLYVGTINSNSTLSQTGQALFTYNPADTTYTESSVLINPTSPSSNELMLGIGQGGYEKAGFDAEGDLTLGYSDAVTAPTSDNPLTVYGHSGTQLLSVNLEGSLTLNGISSSSTNTEGTIYYDSDDSSLYVYTGSAFSKLTTSLSKYSNSNSSLANGNYVEVAHNQNTNDIQATGWYYDTVSSLFRSIDNYTTIIKQALSNEFGDAASGAKIRTETTQTSVRLQQTADTGTGADGAITINSDTDINSANSISGRTCADGGDAVNYSVTALTSTTATLESSPSAGCLSAGDEILLINLQGTTTSYGNVGNYETLTISSVTSNVVTFTTAKTKYFGANSSDDTSIGLSAGDQIVMLQRVPNYTNVTINNSGTDFTPDSWVSPTGVANNGAGEGGVMFFRATGTVSLGAGTTINANGKGYIGGAGGTGGLTYGGYLGESYDISGNTTVSGGGSSQAATNAGGKRGNASTSSPNDGFVTGGGGGGGNAGNNGTDNTGAGGGGGGYAGGGGGGGGGRYNNNPGGAGGTGGTVGISGGGGGGCGTSSNAAGGNAGSAGSSALGTGGEAGSGAISASGGGGCNNSDSGGGGGGGGSFYGTADLSTLFFGSAGGGGGAKANGTTGEAGGNGGAIVYISADIVSNSGSITSTGDNGTASTDAGNGGGGAGGSIKLTGNTITLGTTTALGGTVGGSNGGDGGNGGDGRIAIYYTDSVSGSTSPSAGTSSLTGYNNYGVYNSAAIPTSNAISYDLLRWEENLDTYGNIEFQTRSGNSTDPTDGTWESWKPSTNGTDYTTLQSADTHTDWTGTNATVADGDVTRNVDFYEDEDESTAGNITKITSSTSGGYAEATISSTDISSYDYITAWVRASQTGTTLRFGFGESAATEQTEDIKIDTANTWQKVYWDLSDITGTSRDAVTKLRITNLTSSSNTIYIDNVRAAKFLSTTSGSTISSTPDNYIEYRAIFTTTNASYQPSLENVTIGYKNGFKIEQTDANTVRMYNYTGSTQNVRLDVVTFGADLAEWYATDDSSIAAGDVVSLTGEKDLNTVPKIKKATSDDKSKMIGIISTKAGQEIGLSGDNRRLVALSGRVPVKISTNSANINPGDFVTASDTPGFGKRATTGDYYVGKAMEGWTKDSGKQTITVFMDLGYLYSDLNAPTTQVKSASTESGVEIATASAQTTTDYSKRIKNIEESVTNLEKQVNQNTNLLLTTTTSPTQDTSSSSFDKLLVLGNSVLSDTVINGTLNIGVTTIGSKDSTINSITSLKLQPLALSTIEFEAGAIEMGKNGNLVLNKGVLKGNTQIRDKVAIPSGQNTVRVSKNWQETPISIVLTPSYETAFWVSDIDKTGFTIHVSKAPEKDQTIYWWAIW